MNTINIQQFIAMCNDYIADSSALSLSSFLTSKGYMDQTKTGLAFSENIAISADKVNNAKLNISAGFASNIDGKAKIKEMVEFVAYHAQEITDTEVTTKNDFICTMAAALGADKTSINIEQAAYNNLASADFQLYNPNMKIPKSRPKTSFWAKRVGVPAAIAAGVAGITYAIAANANIPINSSYFSPDGWATFAQWASSAAVVAAAGSASYTLLSKAIIRNHYKKYCQKGKNIESIVDSNTNINSLTQLHSNEVPLKLRELMVKLRTSNDKFITHKNQNHKIRAFFASKTHRNQLWALASYAQYLRDYMAEIEDHKDSTSPKTQAAVKLLMEYIDNNISIDIRNNFESSANPYESLANIDIYSTIARGLAKKDDLGKVKSECFKLMSKLTLDRFKTTADTTMFGLVKTLPETEELEVVDAYGTAPTETVNVSSVVDDKSSTPVVEETIAQQSLDSTKTPIVTETVATETATTESTSAISPISTSTQRKLVKAASEKLIISPYKKKHKLVYTGTDGNKRKLDIHRTGNDTIDSVVLGAAVQQIMGSEAVKLDSEDLNSVIEQ